MVIIEVMHAYTASTEATDKIQNFRSAVSNWKSDGEKSIEHKKMRERFLDNAGGLQGYLQGSQGKADYYFTVGEGIDSIQGAADFRGKVAWRGAIDLSEVIKNPSKDSKSLGCLFHWVASKADTVTLTANTNGLIKYYERFGFAAEDTAAQAYENSRAGLEKQKAFVDKLGTSSGGNVEDPLAAEIVKKYGDHQDLRGLKADQLSNSETIAKLRRHINESIDDLKFQVVDLQMTLKDRSKLSTHSNYKEVVVVAGGKLKELALN